MPVSEPHRSHPFPRLKQASKQASKQTRLAASGSLKVLLLGQSVVSSKSFWLIAPRDPKSGVAPEGAGDGPPVGIVPLLPPLAAFRAEGGIMSSARSAFNRALSRARALSRSETAAFARDGESGRRRGRMALLICPSVLASTVFLFRSPSHLVPLERPV